MISEGTDDVDECAAVMIGWGVVCTDSAYVSDLHADGVKPVNEYIYCLDNLGFRLSTFKEGNEVARVVMFCKRIVFSDRIECVVDREAKTW